MMKFGARKLSRIDRRTTLRTRVALDVLEARALLSTMPLLVQLNPGVSAAIVSDVAADGVTVRPTTIAGLEVVSGDAEALARVSARLADSPGIQYVQPEETLTEDLAPTDPAYTAGTQWDMNGTYGINAPAAWSVTTGSGQVIVADVDTGIDYNHPELYDNIWINQAEIPASRMANLVDVYHDGYISMRDLNSPANQGPGKIMDQNNDGLITAADLLKPMQMSNGQDTGYGGWANPNNTQDGDTTHPDDLVGWNFVNNTNDPYDDYGHGTHTAGTIGMQANNGVGGAGVNWNVSIMALKFLDSSGSGTDVDAAEAIVYAAAHNAKVSNNSYGGGDGSTTLENAIKTAQAAGDIFVAAAGNSSQNTDNTANYPSAYPEANIIAVAATDINGNIAGFSNYGHKTVDLAAPGVNIYSTLPGNNFANWSGTSMATPHVTGTVALLQAEHPSWTASQIISQILNTVTPDPSVAGKTVTGGILNAGAAIATNQPPPSVGNAGFESPVEGAGNFSYDPSNPSWSFAGASGVSGNGSAFTTSNPSAPEGAQVAFLQQTGSFSQAVTGWAAGSYQVSFAAAQRGSYNGSGEDFGVTVDGQSVGTFKPSGASYGSYTTATFSVSSGSHTIAFQGLDTAGGDNTAFVDAVTVAAATSGVMDAGFESPVEGAGNFSYDPSNPSWSFAGASGVSGNGSAFTTSNPSAPEGVQVAFLQQTGSFSQAVAGWAAGSYQVSFAAAQRGRNNASGEDFRVLVDGQSVGTFKPSGASYGSYTTATFSVSSGSHTIAFQGLDTAGGDNTAFVDAVTVAAATSGVMDAGFESPVEGAGNFSYDPSNPSWSFAGASGVSGNGSAFTTSNPSAPEGVQVAFLQQTGSFSQAVTGWAAGTYQVGFAAAQRGSYNGSGEDFGVTVDGQSVGTFKPSGASYGSYTTATFSVSSGSHTIAFQGLDTAGGDNTAFIDAIKLIQI